MLRGNGLAVCLGECSHRALHERDLEVAGHVAGEQMAHKGAELDGRVGVAALCDTLEEPDESGLDQALCAIAGHAHKERRLDDVDGIAAVADAAETMRRIQAVDEKGQTVGRKGSLDGVDRTEDALAVGTLLLDAVRVGVPEKGGEIGRAGQNGPVALDAQSPHRDATRWHSRSKHDAGFPAPRAGAHCGSARRCQDHRSWSPAVFPFLVCRLSVPMCRRRALFTSPTFF
ncbi:hypothetical protein [Pandoravirus japonicus]|uniref:Uncharacterized protein n=1 Tax=Pandoravirus japonicus TaxID=2823154 RepID=A0A811BNL8_9VIRU|nr:hypothetical protein [Pandoravirus japonicus]